MTANRTVIHINPRSELANALRCAEASDGIVLIDAGDLIFEVDVLTARDAREAAGYNPDVRDSFLDIAGIGESREPSDIERFKDEYLADAYLPKPE